MIKVARLLFNFYIIFNKLEETIVYTIMDMIIGY